MGRYDILLEPSKPPAPKVSTPLPTPDTQPLEKAASMPEAQKADLHANLQTRKSANLQASKPVNQQTRLHANPQAGKLVSLQTGKQVFIEKYSSYLTHEYKKECQVPAFLDAKTRVNKGQSANHFRWQIDWENDTPNFRVAAPGCKS